MDSPEAARKTRAIMFSDIQGYSKLMGEDEALCLKLLEEHNLICVPLIKRHHGTPVKFIGDAILSAFESAADAVQAGLELQRLLAERNASRPDIVPLVIRIGIHIGDVLFKDGDVFGDGVNIAARIEPLAEPGGIAISQTVYDMIKARPEIQTVSLGAKELKNIKEAVNIYKVVVDASRPDEPGADWAMMAKALLAFMVVAVGATVYLNRRPVAPPASAALPAPIAAEAPSEQDAAARKALERERTEAFWKMHDSLLVSKTVPDAEKARIAQAYYDHYHDFPGINPGTAAELSKYLPAGPARDEIAALAASPVGREAVARGRLKYEASKRVAEALKVSAAQKRDWIKQCPLSATSWLVDIKDGEPALDAQGRVQFKYRLPNGQERVVPITADVLKDGPAGEAGIARAAGDLAADYLKVR